jgi:hypothetical protein
MVLHAAGKWKESIAALTEADRLSQQLDVVSISEEAVTLISNEREKTYRGEDFEKLMISVFLALNYAQLGQDEDALVEVRRVNERLRKMVNEEKKPYEQLAIARYVGGILYEDQGDLDSAFIDYYDAYKLQPRLGSLAEPLLRIAKATGREDAYRELLQNFPDIPHEPLGSNEGQLVVIVEAGLSPEKQSDAAHPGRDPAKIIAIPVYRDRGAPRPATVTVENMQQQTVAVTSLRDVAQQYLNDRIGRMLAKQLAAAVVKAGLATGVGELTKSKEAGYLAFLLLSATNRPDLRSWLSLPGEFQLVRFRLPTGKHVVTVTGNPTESKEVMVEPHRITFAIMRLY